MGVFGPSEREKWASLAALSPPSPHLGLPGLDPLSQALYGKALPRGVLMPRFMSDRPPVNHWMRPHELAAHVYRPGQILLGKFAGQFIGALDDRPIVTVAGARSGKTSTVLEPNLYLWPGSCVVLDPKGTLCARTARVRQALGHDVYVLDPFGQSGEASASFNALAELDPDDDAIIDDVASITQALIVDDGDSRSKHWNDSARTLLQGIILLTLLLPEEERHLVAVRQLLSLTHPRLVRAVKSARTAQEEANTTPDFFNENKVGVETLLGAMATVGDTFGRTLAAIGNRFLATPATERGSIFSTAAAQTDFLSSMPVQAMSRRSDFPLAALRSDRPTTIYLVLPVGRAESHYRWLRLIVQMICITLEKMGSYPRDRTPILLLAEEFAILKSMSIMASAAAYFPEFGLKSWIVLQDVNQLFKYYSSSAETILGNSGTLQFFSNSDQPTLDMIARRVEGLIRPFELRTAFARETHAQLLLMEGKPPAAAIRLEHEDVAAIRAQAIRWAQARLRSAIC